MGFDFVSQLQGPQIDIGLYGDAALKGAQVGAMTPTPFAAATEGLMKGLVTGANLYNTAADNVRADEAVEVAKKNAETSAQQAKDQAEYQKARIEIEKQQLEAQKVEQARLQRAADAEAKWKQVQLDEAKRKEGEVTARKKAATAITTGLSNGSLSVEQILSDSKFTPILTDGSKESESLLGYMAQYAKTPQSQNTIKGMANFKLQMDLENDLAKSTVARQEASKKQYEAAKTAMLGDADVPNVIKTLDHRAFWGNAIEVHPSYADPYLSEEQRARAKLNWKSTDLGAFNIYKDKKLLTATTGKGADAVSKTQAYARDMRGYDYDALESDNAAKSATPQLSGTTAVGGTPNFNPAQAQQQMAAEGFDSGKLGSYSQKLIQDRAAYTEKSPIISRAAYAVHDYFKRLNLFDKETAQLGSKADTPGWHPVENALGTSERGWLQSKITSIAEAATSIDGDPVENARNLVVQDFVGRKSAAMAEAVRSTDSATVAALDEFKESTGIDPTNKNDVKEYYTTLAESEISKYDRGVTSSIQAEESSALKALARGRAMTSNDPLMVAGNKREAQNLVDKARNQPAPTGEYSKEDKAFLDSAFDTETPKPIIILPPESLTKNEKAAFSRVTTEPAFSNSSPDIKALAMVENSGRVQDAAVSKTGVIGPLQVTGATAAKYEAQYGLSNKKPEDQIKIAGYLINDLQSKFTQAVITATGSQPDETDVRMLSYGAYNAGESVILEAVKLSGSTDWKRVKKYLKPALAKYPKALGGQTVEEKYAELVDYPEKVLKGYNAIIQAA